MHRDRFLLISKFLHFTPNECSPDLPDVPKNLEKLWPVLQHMKNKFSSVYTLEEHMSIDK